MSSSDGEGLETGRAQTQVPCQSFTRQPSFRDTKDLRFGMGMSHTHIKNPERRDRMLLLNAFAIFLMTLLGAAGESLGFDRLLKANTVKYRTPSLFRQGCMYYRLIPTMPEKRLRPLIERFTEMLAQHPTADEAFAMAYDPYHHKQKNEGICEGRECWR